MLGACVSTVLPVASQVCRGLLKTRGLLDLTNREGRSSALQRIQRDTRGSCTIGHLRASFVRS